MSRSGSGGGSGASRDSSGREALLSALSQSNELVLADAAEKFIEMYSECYEFADRRSEQLFAALRTYILCNGAFFSFPTDRGVRLLQCARLLLRDVHIQDLLVADLESFRMFCGFFAQVARAHYHDCSEPVMGELLTALCSIVKNLAKRDEVRPALLECHAELGLVTLLHADDAVVVQTSIAALINLNASRQLVPLLHGPEILDLLLHMVDTYELEIRVPALQFLHGLVHDKALLAEALQLGLVAISFRALSPSLDEARIVRLHLRLLATVTRSATASKQVRHVGGIPLLVHLLASSVIRVDAYAVVCVCTILTNVSGDPDNCIALREANAVFQLGSLILHAPWGTKTNPHQVLEHIFRAMRFLYGAERNRVLFKRLLPVNLFGLFIDVGPYVYDIAAYRPLAEELLRMSDSLYESLAAGLASVDLTHRPQQRIVGEYIFLELAGQGGYGSVYEARKKDGGEQRFAVKELTIDSSESMLRIQDEVSILSQLEHPGIVRFYQAFRFGRQQFIVMEYVNGITLQEMISSFGEKKQHVPEDVAWSVFIQICAALQYLHVEKRIVHRDVKPANIMCDAQFNIKLMDFGLASHNADGKAMESMVGTMNFCCPEMVQRLPYNAKADIWSLGCVLYQLLTSRPPFSGDNPFHVAQRVSEGVFEPLPDTVPPLLRKVVAMMLTVDPALRPSIEEVTQTIAPMILQQYDRVTARSQQLRAQLLAVEAEKQRFEEEALRSRGQISRLFTPRRETPSSPHRPRPGSSAQSIIIAADRLRAVDDPLSLYMNQMHKLLFVEHLPPDGVRSTNRRIVNRYVRELFGSRSSRYDLKNEMQKLVNGSPEYIIADTGGLSMVGANDAEADVTSRSPTQGHRTTYAELLQLIEECLMDSGYYTLPKHAAPDEAAAAPGSAGRLPPVRGNIGELSDTLRSNRSSASGPSSGAAAAAAVSPLRGPRRSHSSSAAVRVLSASRRPPPATPVKPRMRKSESVHGTQMM